MSTKKNLKSEAVVTVKTPLQRQQSQIYKLKKELNLIKKNIEKKYQYENFSEAQISSATGIVLSALATITLGTGQGERIGQLINSKYIQMQFAVNLSSTTLSGTGSIDLVLDRMPLGSVPTVSTIYGSTDPFALPNPLSRKRFKVLSHNTFVYDKGTLSELGQLKHVYIPLNDLQTCYINSSGTIGDIDKNDILVVIRSSNTSTGNVSYGIKGAIKVCYIDT